MKRILFVFSLAFLCLALNACSYRYDSSRCGYYGCTVNARTAPSICDSNCANPCNLMCTNNNFYYSGCGDNCVVP